MTCDPELVVTEEAIASLQPSIVYIDEVIESPLDTAITPGGLIRNTLQGQLKKLGFQAPVVYAAVIGFGTNDNTKTIDRNGIIYAPLPSELPFSTTGIWGGDDELKFFVIQGGPQEYDTINDALADTTAAIGAKFHVHDYATGNNSGPLFFERVASGTGDVDFGEFFDHDTLPQQIQANFPARRNVKMWGAVGDGVTDDTAAFIAASNAITDNYYLIVPPEIYRIAENAPPTSTHENFYSNSIIRFIGKSNVTIDMRGSTILMDNRIGVTNDITGSTVEVRGPAENITILLGKIKFVETFPDSGAGHAVSIVGYITEASFTSPFTFFDASQVRSFDVGVLYNVKVIGGEIEGGPQTGIFMNGVWGGEVTGVTVNGTEKECVAITSCHGVTVEDITTRNNKDDAVSFVCYFDDGGPTTNSANGPYFLPGLTTFANDGCKLLGLTDTNATPEGQTVAGFRILGSINMQVRDVITKGRGYASLMFSTASTEPRGLNFIPSQNIDISGVIGTDLRLSGAQVNGFDETGRREFFGCHLDNYNVAMAASANLIYQSVNAQNFRVSRYRGSSKDFELTDCVNVALDEITPFNANFKVNSTNVVGVGAAESAALDVKIKVTDLKLISNASATGGGVALFVGVKNASIHGMVSDSAVSIAGIDCRDCFNVNTYDLEVVDPDRSSTGTARTIFFENCKLCSVQGGKIVTDLELIPSVITIDANSELCKVTGITYFHTGTVINVPVSPLSLGNNTVSLLWYHSSLVIDETFTNMLPRAITGAGSPEGVRAHPVGTTYQNLTGGGGTTFYVKETGGEGVTTGWVAK